MADNNSWTAGRAGTTVAEPGWVRHGSWVACPLLGATAGWLLKSLADWAASAPWFPLQGAFRLVASFPEPQRTLGALVLGALAGAVFAYLWARDRLLVTVSPNRVTLQRGETATSFERSSVTAVFLDGKNLVLLGDAGVELAREPSDLPAARLRDAFVDHSYPWRADGDPYAGEYWLWVPDSPGLSAHANALLRARDKALHRFAGEDARELRAELARLGVFVREEKKRQYWRTSRRRESAGD